MLVAIIVNEGTIGEEVRDDRLGFEKVALLGLAGIEINMVGYVGLAGEERDKGRAKGLTHCKLGWSDGL